MSTKSWPNFRKAVVGLCGAAAAVTLSACSGGGGGSTVPGPPLGPTMPIQLAAGMVVGQSVFPNGDAVGGGRGQPIDAIPCNSASAGYHVHAHLSLFHNGTQVAIPLAIGITNPQPPQSGIVTSGSCFYQLHTHDASGIIHVEAPQTASFTLGEFFDIWGQPLSASGAAGLSGSLSTYVNGVAYGGDPRTILLTEHQQITLEVGAPLVRPPQYVFPSNY